MQRRQMLQGVLGLIGWAVTGFGLLKHRVKPAVLPDPVISTAAPPRWDVVPFLGSSMQYTLRDEVGLPMLVRYGIEQKVTRRTDNLGLVSFEGGSIKGFLEITPNYKPLKAVWEKPERDISEYKLSENKLQVEAMIYDLTQLVNRVNRYEFRQMNTGIIVRQMVFGVAIVQDCLKQQFLTSE